MRKWVLGLALASVGVSITFGLGVPAMAADRTEKVGELTLDRVFGLASHRLTVEGKERYFFTKAGGAV